MASSASNFTKVDNFFSSSAARFDRWRELNAKAQTWAAGARSGNARAGRATVEAALAEVRPLEDFFAYPGARLMKTLVERIAADDALGTARLVRRVSGALLTESYRHESGQWETSDEDNDSAPESLGQTFQAVEARRPYFEALFVTPTPAANLGKLANEIRRLRRVEDAMIYEPVLVGSVEDAMLATILNGKIQSVVIFDGIPVPSRHDVPLLRDLLTTYQHLDASS